MSKKYKQPTWASRVGFILTAAGASIGLGNLQRFPQYVDEHGSAFVFCFLVGL